MYKRFLAHSSVIQQSFFAIPFFLLNSLAFSSVRCKEELNSLGTDLLPVSANLPLDSFSIFTDSHITISTKNW